MECLKHGMKIVTYQEFLELNGKKWDLSLLKALIDNGTIFIVCIELFSGDSWRLFYFKSNKVLEIFMMSTTRENQKAWNKSSLSRRDIFTCPQKLIKYINWQAQSS